MDLFYAFYTNYSERFAPFRFKIATQKSANKHAWQKPRYNGLDQNKSRSPNTYMELAVHCINRLILTQEMAQKYLLTMLVILLSFFIVSSSAVDFSELLLSKYGYRLDSSALISRKNLTNMAEAIISHRHLPDDIAVCETANCSNLVRIMIRRILSPPIIL